MKYRWGYHGMSHFAIIRNLVRDCNFLLCSPLLVDLCIACFSPKHVRVFIVDKADDSSHLNALERYYITQRFKDEQGRVINLETSSYGLNMKNT